MNLQEKYYEEQYLKHHGIKGQKWGRRRFQNPDGSLTPDGQKRYGTGDDQSTKGIGGRTHKNRDVELIDDNRSAKGITGKSKFNRDPGNMDDQSAKGFGGKAKKNQEIDTSPESKSAKEITDQIVENRDQYIMTKDSQTMNSVGKKPGHSNSNDDSRDDNRGSDKPDPGDGNGSKRLDDSRSKDDDGEKKLPGNPSGKKGNNKGDDPSDGKKNDDQQGVDNKTTNKDAAKHPLNIQQTKNAVNDISKGTKDATDGMSDMIDIIQNMQRKEKMRNSNVRVMSNAEIQSAITRMNLEKQYNEAKYGNEVNVGAEKAKAILSGIGSVVAVAGGIVTLALGIKQLRGN